MEETTEQQTTTEQTTQTTDPLDNEQVNKAAYEFTNLVPQIRAFAKNMNRNGVARVLTAFIEFPLAEKYPKFRTKEENQLFMMCLHAQGSKQIMTDAVFSQNKGLIKEIQDEAVQGVVNEVLESKEKEVSDELEKTGDTTQG